MDWEDKQLLEVLGGIKEGEVAIYVYDGSARHTVTDEQLFLTMVYDYGCKLLELSQTESKMDSKWKVSMAERLKGISNQLRHRAQ